MNQRQVWDFIAPSWKRFRKMPVEGVEEFVDGHDMVLDLACASGRNFMPGRKYIGVDFSENMLRYAKKDAEEKGIDTALIKADVAALPLKDGKFDTVLFVAILHAVKERERALAEMKRVMKKDGRAYITVWNRQQPKFFLAKKEFAMPWRVMGKVYERYNYPYGKIKLRNLLSKYFRVEKIYGSREKALKLFPKNIIAIVRKE